MPKITPQEAAEKYARRMKAATDDIRKGVERVTEAPGRKAAAKQEKMLRKLQEAVQSGKWARRVAAVSLEDWKRQMLEKGVNRISAGVDGATPKLADFFAQLFPYQESLQGKIRNMPDATIEDSIARAAEWIRGMANFERK